jgi:hypothetical protein
MDDVEDVVIFEAPDGALQQCAKSIAMEGQSKSVLMAKMRSQHLLPFALENSESTESLPATLREWKLVHCYPTNHCYLRNGRLDAEDINFDMYSHARDLMELSRMKTLQ